MPTGLHFPFRFDRQRLRADLVTAQSVEWVPHYNEKDYGGIWTGISLRSITGDSRQLLANSAETFTDTPLLDQCAYFREVLSVFQCPLKSVRLLSLAPQSFIREHSDHALGYDDGEIRIHVPIQTNPDVEFYLAGERLLLEEGHSYFLNVNLPHRVNNRGRSERIHLVIDAAVNEWVHGLFHQGIAKHWDVPRCPWPPRNVDEFRRHVLTQPVLQRQLQTVASPDRFSDTVMELGARLGFDFHDGDIGAALRCGPLPWQGHDLRLGPGWTPVRVSSRDSEPVAEWLYTGTRRFTEPFFEDSVRVALRDPFARLFRCEAPLRIAGEIDGSQTLEPTGFIFHMSRCGSTLVSQMLSVLPGHIMISEPPPLDDVLQAKQQSVEWVRWLVRALGHRRNGGETGYFIKMDAWHIHNLPQLRAAFPKTPWIFIHRNPLEVLVSQVAKPGRLAIPGALDPHMLGFDSPDVTRLSKEEWCVEALSGILRAALAAKNDPQVLFIPYRDLPEAVFGPIAAHFHISLSDDDKARMREVTAFDAKNPSLWFESDRAAKQAGATTALRELCAVHLEDVYRELQLASGPFERSTRCVELPPIPQNT